MALIRPSQPVLHACAFRTLGCMGTVAIPIHSYEYVFRKLTFEEEFALAHHHVPDCSS